MEKMIVDFDINSFKKALVICPVHGNREVDADEARMALAGKRNPCPLCGESKIENPKSKIVLDPWARKWAGWRRLVEKIRGSSFVVHGLESRIYQQKDLDGLRLAPRLLREGFDVGDKRHRFIYFPNKMEANYWRILSWQQEHGIIEGFQHQPAPLDFTSKKEFGIRRYRPDFLMKRKMCLRGRPKGIPLPQMVYVEVKGRMDAKSLTKLRLVARHCPELGMEVITSAKVMAKWQGKFPEYWRWVAWGELKEQWAPMIREWEA